MATQESFYEPGRFPVPEKDRLTFQHAAYIADPNTKRIIDTRGSTIDFRDIDLIRQGLAKLNGERPMNAPRLPSEPRYVEEGPSFMEEIEALVAEIDQTNIPG